MKEEKIANTTNPVKRRPDDDVFHSVAPRTMTQQMANGKSGA